MRKYAENTTITPGQSKLEIETMLGKRYKATHFTSSEQDNAGFIAFRFQGRNIVMKVARPDTDDYQYSEGGRERDLNARQVVADREYARRWRVLVVRLKMMMEDVCSGDIDVDEVFMPYYLMGNGQTLLDQLKPQLGGEMPNMLALPAWGGG